MLMWLAGMVMLSHAIIPHHHHSHESSSHETCSPHCSEHHHHDQDHSHDHELVLTHESKSLSLVIGFHHPTNDDDDQCQICHYKTDATNISKTVKIDLPLYTDKSIVIPTPTITNETTPFKELFLWDFQFIKHKSSRAPPTV